MKTRDQPKLEPQPSHSELDRLEPKGDSDRGVLHLAETGTQPREVEPLAERVARIRAQLASGTYRIKTEQIADRIVEDMLVRGRSSPPSARKGRTPGAPDGQ